MSTADPLVVHLTASQLRQLIEEVVLKKLGQQESTPAGALRPKEAAAHIGVGRSKFYELLKEDPQLAEASFQVGTARMWRKEDLDAWMLAQVELKQADPGSQADRYA